MKRLILSLTMALFYVTNVNANPAIFTIQEDALICLEPEYIEQLKYIATNNEDKLGEYYLFLEKESKCGSAKAGLFGEAFYYKNDVIGLKILNLTGTPKGYFLINQVDK